MTGSQIEFPRALFSALRNHQLVIFAGAGVSKGKPARLLDFNDLANKIAQGTEHELQDDEPEDRFLGKLQDKGINVHALAAKILQQKFSGASPQPTSLHCDLLRLYRQPSQVRIVTTNFDLLFNDASDQLFESRPEVFTAPALPLGRDFHGIVHVHGALDRPKTMVLTDADFGRAYLTEGWARRFVVELFRKFAVLFVGYSYTDTVVHYLSRALPERVPDRRFILLPDSKADDDRWQRLGIYPISYPKSARGGHEALNKGIHELADFAARGVLDWQREITELARKSPPIDQPTATLVDQALSDPNRTHFFTRTATEPQWIDWLDERGHLERLFGIGNLTDPDAVVARWLAHSFARQHSSRLFLLIARHGTRLHPQFWHELSRIIGSANNSVLAHELLSQWISLLIATAPLDDANFVRLAKRCSDQGLMHPVVQIFDALTASRLSLYEHPVWSETEDDASTTRLDVRLTLAADHEASVRRLWQLAIKPHLEQIAENLLTRIATRLTERHETYRAWQQANRSYDPENFRRHAIETHDQDQISRPINVLIDSGRDCLEWLASKRPNFISQWCNTFANAETPLLRRLTVHALSVRDNLTADEKSEWLLQHMDIHDRGARHELFRAIRQIYPALRKNQRQALLDAIRAYRYPGDEDKQRRTAAHKFDWFHWLHEADPECGMLAQELQVIEKQYPEFKPRDHPDLSYWIGHLVRVDDQTPWTVEELLSRPAADWLSELLSFKPTDILGPRRSGLLLSIQQAAQQNFQWGLDLSIELIHRAEWNSDVWTALLRAWSKPHLNNEQRRLVLSRFTESELRDAHIDSIADFLRESLQPSRFQDQTVSLEQANQLATDLWQRLDPTEIDHKEHQDWLTHAINHPSGNLAQFWLFSLWLWRNKQEPSPNTLNAAYRLALSTIVRDESLIGTLGQSILCRSFAFLLEADSDWTEKYLLPLFDVEFGLPQSTAAWSGFLYGNTSISAIEVMKPAFLEATSRLQTDFHDQDLTDRFIEAYTYALFFHIQDPTETWIPTLFQYTKADGRQNFARHVGHYLSQLDESQQRECWARWIKTYWKARLDGVPKLLASEEIDTMLSWIPNMNSLFTEAVTIATQMPRLPLDNGFVLDQILESTFHESHPTSVAQLLDYLSHCVLKPYVWKGAIELITQLLQSDIPDELKTRLREILAEFRLD